MIQFNKNIRTFSKPLFQASQTYGGRVAKWPLGGTGVHCRHSQPRCKELPRLAAQTVGHPGRCWSRVWLQKLGLRSSFLPTRSVRMSPSLVHFVFYWCAVSVPQWSEFVSCISGPPLKALHDYINKCAGNICLIQSPGVQTMGQWAGVCGESLGRRCEE